MNRWGRYPRCPTPMRVVCWRRAWASRGRPRRWPVLLRAIEGVQTIAPGAIFDAKRFGPKLLSSRGNHQESARQLITEREDFFNSLPGVTGTTAATTPPAPRSPFPFSVLPGRCGPAGASIARLATPAPSAVPRPRRRGGSTTGEASRLRLRPVMLPGMYQQCCRYCAQQERTRAPAPQDRSCRSRRPREWQKACPL